MVSKVTGNILWAKSASYAPLSLEQYHYHEQYLQLQLGTHLFRSHYHTMTNYHISKETINQHKNI
jgi:hypothetical protein